MSSVQKISPNTCVSKLESSNDIIEDVVDGNNGIEMTNHEDSLNSNDSTTSRESAGSNTSSGAPKLNGNVIKTTVTSVSSHLAVIAKTYTKRHSSSNIQQQNSTNNSTNTVSPWNSLHDDVWSGYKRMLKSSQKFPNLAKLYTKRATHSVNLKE